MCSLVYLHSEKQFTTAGFKLFKFCLSLCQLLVIVYQKKNPEKKSIFSFAITAKTK